MTDEELGRHINAAIKKHFHGCLSLTDEAERVMGAAARELLAPPISRMSVEECRALAKRAWAEHKGGVEASIYAVGDAFHRLAQPARVDEGKKAPEQDRILFGMHRAMSAITAETLTCVLQYLREKDAQGFEAWIGEWRQKGLEEVLRSARKAAAKGAGDA